MTTPEFTSDDLDFIETLIENLSTYTTDDHYVEMEQDQPDFEQKLKQFWLKLSLIKNQKLI